MLGWPLSRTLWYFDANEHAARGCHDDGCRARTALWDFGMPE
jgi:hypothetical protein